MLLTILFLLVVVLAVITSARLMKVFEFTAKLRGKQPHEITENENNVNAFLVLMSVIGLFILFFYLNIKYYNFNYIPIPASLHGAKIETLLDINFMFISAGFLLLETLLFYFAYRYRYKKGKKASHVSHNNKLEIVWTIIPSIFLIFLILKGMLVWNIAVQQTEAPDRITIELYARQFDWHARYAGEDGELGKANYCMISAYNPLGVIINTTIDEQLKNIKQRIHRQDSLKGTFPAEEELAQIEKTLSSLNHQKNVVEGFKVKSSQDPYNSGLDDIIKNDTIVIPVGRNIDLRMRAQEVLHSAFLPDFRVHMYCVPGIETKFSFIPTITTTEMRKKLGKPNFNYLLYCNNICGSSHFNMKLYVRVVTEKEYAKWNKRQNSFGEVTMKRLNEEKTQTALLN